MPTMFGAGWANLGTKHKTAPERCSAVDLAVFRNPNLKISHK
jgi:hypothetical protein